MIDREITSVTVVAHFEVLSTIGRGRDWQRLLAQDTREHIGPQLLESG